MAPVIHACATAKVECAVCVTAQHREMLDQMLAVFGIRPDYDLNVMQENQSPLAVAARVACERSRPLGCTSVHAQTTGEGGGKSGEDDEKRRCCARAPRRS